MGYTEWETIDEDGDPETSLLSDTKADIDVHYGKSGGSWEDKYENIPAFSTDRDAASKVYKKVKELGVSIAEDASPLEICLAALKAIGIKA